MEHHPIISGFVAIGALVVAVLTLLLNNRNSNLTNRPYWGPLDNKVEFMRCGVTGCVDSSPDAANIFKYAQLVKNSGNIPAENAFTIHHVYLDDEETGPPYDGEDHPSRVMPGVINTYSGEVGMVEFPDVMSGKKKLYIELTLSYEWPGGSEKRCYETRYDHISKGFSDFGNCVPFTHTPGEIKPKK
jgi:hypothetical protein